MIKGKVKILKFKSGRDNVYRIQGGGLYIVYKVIKPTASIGLYSDTTSLGIHPVLKTKGRTIWESR